MHNERTKKSFLSIAGIVFCFIFLATILQGCEPLRKKFTRHKKGESDDQQYEPILDPIDYPDKVYDPKADYKYRFSLFHVWEKEFLAGVDDRTSAKRLKYFVENIIIQLQEMEKIVLEDKRMALQKAIQGFSGVLETLNQPSQFYNLRDLKIEVEQLAKPILLSYTPSDMEGSLKP
jgi:hypothetical protein